MRRRSFLAATVAASVVGTVGATVAVNRPWSAPATAVAPQHSGAARHVILIDWDGVAPGYLDALFAAGELPVLRALADNGGRSTVSCSYKAISNPNRSSLATGAWPAIHRNTAYVLAPDTGRAIGQTRRLDAETIAQSLRRQNRTVLAAGWYIVQKRGSDYGDPAGLYTQSESWEETVDAVVGVLRGEAVRSGWRGVRMRRIPDLIAAYTADVDAIGHREGPDSPRVRERLLALDTGLGRIVDAARWAGIAEQTTFAFVSDHGMTGYTETLEPAVLGAIRHAGFSVERLYSGHLPLAETEVVLTASPRAANVYLRGRAATAAGRAQLAEILAGLDELEGVHDREHLDALGAAPEEGDFVIEARPPYAFLDPAAVDGRTRGGHASAREGHAPLILAGAGIRPGHQLRQATIVDVAPTLSHLLGAAPPAHAQGRVLEEALEDISSFE
ncbi:alkaline phosphatase family protein [Salinactinospora qingdaonensis]|uniref:Ectonucleotide pyrophosphatase/phosphodiesterase n=1 Tax=Salinactinospora qingdaonensis TaxID=702744 RepID=A0ABP7FXF3_9ACTN